MGTAEVRPLAKSEGILSTDLASGEVVVFVRQDNRAHCLNSAAASIWRGCNGERTVGELAVLVSESSGVPIDEDVVLKSLGELQGLGLIETLPEGPTEGAGLTRRQAFVRVGSVAASAAAMIPVVVTVLAPKSAAAASCQQPGAPCSVGSQCCSGNCLPGGVCA